MITLKKITKQQIIEIVIEAFVILRTLERILF